MSDVQVVVVSTDTERTVVANAAAQISVIEITDVGPQGPPGQGFFVGPNTPTNPPLHYLWVQTGLGTDGTDITMWVEDGAP